MDVFFFNNHTIKQCNIRFKFNINIKKIIYFVMMYC
jgi:hypothetical protein